MEKEIKHPAVYSSQFMDVFYSELKDCNVVLDPFAGTGKIALIKEFGFSGKIICNDLEPEYKHIKKYDVDFWYHLDAASLFIDGIDGIATSPTYGNRMADSFKSKDASKRITYTHQLGRKLSKENTGAMQWGDKYKQKHTACYINFYKILMPKGKFVLNISDHIRKGKIIEVAEWTKKELIKIGFVLVNTYEIPVKRMRFGKNSHLRVGHEYIFVFQKK